MDSLRDMRLAEKAAKAAGYGVGRWSDDGRGLLLVGVQEPWNPLEDDGDALRLAVKLGISLQFSGNRYSVSRRQVWDICCLWEGDDKCALIRRQIVEEAAASADSKPPNDGGQANARACPSGSPGAQG